MNFELENNKLNKIAKLFIWLLLVYIIGFAVWTLLCLETGNGDNVEHIHSTWLVANGKIPYRDFFQHHNPLLWYIFSPVVWYFADNQMLLLDIAHAISLIAGFLTFFIVYKINICFFTSSKYAALLSLFILCSPHFYIYSFNFNPDTFMALFYAIGLYFLFSYWKNAKLTEISVAFISFFIAFLFTQKILTVLAVLGPISLYVFYKIKSPSKHILYALIIPILGFCLFLAYLNYQDSLEIYWKTNYIFNIVMQDYYGYSKVRVIDYEVLIFSTLLSMISILCFFKKKDIIFRVVSILFIIEFPQRFFYFSLSPYYMLPLMIYICCLNSVIIEKLINKSIIAVYILIAVSLYYAYLSVPKYASSFGKNRDFAAYLSENITPCDSVISSYLSSQAIISKNISYYWASLGHIDVAGEEIGIAPVPDLTALVLKYKPKLIHGGIYWSSYEENRGRKLFIQQISPKVISQYYNPSPFMDYYILKTEFQHKNCQYDKKRKEWLYVD